MRSVPYVSEKAQEVARWMERRLAEVNKDGGILFISVQAHPVPGGNTNKFTVRLGLDRKLEEGTGIALIRHVFDKQIKEGLLTLDAAVYRGIRGGANAATEEAGPIPS
jgi:hypothetical protein